MSATNVELAVIADIARPVTTKAPSGCDYPVYAVTKHDGMVPSADYFKKQVHSRNVEGYKVVARGQFAYATIHLDEGSIGTLNTAEQCLISPMYTVFEVDSARVYAPYLLRLLKSPWALSQYALMGSGSVHRRRSISFQTLGRLKVRLPRLPEQKRIATILDKADNLRRKRWKAIQLADDFLMAVFVEMFGDPAASNRWPQAAVGDLVASVDAGWSAPSRDGAVKAGELGVLKVSAVSSGWFLQEEAKSVDRTIVDRPLIFPRTGDLLFSRANTRELVAACCLVEDDVINRFLPDKLWRVDANAAVATNEYLCFLFKHPTFRHGLTKQATGTSGSMLNISQSKLLQTMAPKPPVVLQRKFSDVVRKTFLARRMAIDSFSQIESLRSCLHDQLLT